MATYYVSDTDGSDSNNGRSKTAALKTIPYAFQLAAGTGNTIEIIDSATYYASGGSVTTMLPGDNGGGQAWTNFTLKAGTDTSGNDVYPVLSGKRTNESGSIVTTNAISYGTGWTVEGLEIRSFTAQAALPASSESTLIIKDCVVHHISSRNTGGSTDGCIEFSSTGVGDETTNIVDRCQFFEVGKYIIGAACTEDVLIRNCLFALWGGTSGNNSAIRLHATGTVVEHCTFSDYQGGTNTHICDLDVGGGAAGTIRNCIFNKIGATVIADANHINNNIFANITTAASGNASSGKYLYSRTAANVNNNIFTPNLSWGSGSSVEGVTVENLSAIKEAYILVEGSDGIGQASGSTVTNDIRNDGRSRLSYAARHGTYNDSDIGCYQHYRLFTEETKTPNSNIGNDFTINDVKNMEYQYRMKLDDKENKGSATAPISKTIKGPANIRRLGHSTPYKVNKG